MLGDCLGCCVLARNGAKSVKLCSIIFRNLDKCMCGTYGDVCFKLLVYVGRVKKMDGPENTGSWAQEADTAYLPPNNTAVRRYH